MKCTNPALGRLITRYELGALEELERESFVDHIVSCEYCHNEVYSMGPFMRVLRLRRVAATSGVLSARGGERGAVLHQTGRVVPMWRRTPVVIAALLLLALAMTTVMLRYRTSGRSATGALPWADVHVPKAEYRPADHGSLLRGGDAGALFERGMEAYARDDYATASNQLEMAIRLRPDDGDARFYDGVSLLMLGRNDEATDRLRQAVRLTGGARHEESMYYLGLALLKCDRPGEARAELVAVIELDGTHRGSAERLKNRIDTAVR